MVGWYGWLVWLVGMVGWYGWYGGLVGGSVAMSGMVVHFGRWFDGLLDGIVG